MRAAARTWTDDARRAAVQMLETLDLRASRVAAALGVSERTLRRWRARVRTGAAPTRPVGRRCRPVAREHRQAIIRALLQHGPRVGVAVLRALCDEVPYRQIAALKRRFCRVLVRRWGWYRRRLRWLRAGATWAMDFMRPKGPKLGRGRGQLLHVRDLASGATLLVLACRGERSGVVCAALGVLFLALGVPLLIKMDNGSGFRAHETQAELARHGVTALYSPPYTPSYNGSSECEGCSLKRRIAHQALARGDPGHWTHEDLVAAQRQANTTARPWGATGPTPAEGFAARTPITDEERAAFQRTRDREIANLVETHEERNGKMPTCSQHAAIDRLAVQRALCEHGYLEFRRGRLSTPISTWRAVAEA